MKAAFPKRSKSIFDKKMLAAPSVREVVSLQYSHMYECENVMQESI